MAEVVEDPQAAPAWVPLPLNKQDIEQGVERIITTATPVDFNGATPQPSRPAAAAIEAAALLDATEQLLW